MQHRPTLFLPVALCIGLLCVTGCAPEGSESTETLRPGEIGTLETPQNKTPSSPNASSGEKAPSDIATDEDLGEIEGRVPVETEKTPTLPSSFPSGEVPIPNSAVIDNAGERANGSWFVVLKYPALSDAHEGLADITENGAFTVVSADQGDTDFTSTLEKGSLTVEALGFEDGSASYLNLDVSVVP